MTSISATSSGGYLSPLQQLQAELQSEVNSGTIGLSDQGALSSALKGCFPSLTNECPSCGPAVDRPSGCAGNPAIAAALIHQISLGRV